MMPRRLVSLALIAVAAAGIGCDPRTDLAAVVPTLALSRTVVSPTGTLAGAPIAETVTIVNGTDGTLENLSASVQYQGTAAGWLAVALDRTTATRDQPATLRLQLSPGVLPLGLYLARVVVAASGAGNGPLSIAVRFAIDPRPPAKIVLITQPSSQLINGQTLAVQPVVQLVNGLDEVTPKAGVVITASIATGGPTGELTGPASATTDATGRATFAGLGILGLVGTRTLVFSAPNLATATSTAIDLAPGPAARLEGAAPTSQTADAGTAVTEPPRARVVDQSGNGIVGVAVLFTASPGSAITPGGAIVTGAGGLAGPTSWTLSPSAGGNTVTASASGLTGSPLTFAATGRAGPASQLIKQSGDNFTGLVGKPLGVPHVVQAADRFGNGVAGVVVGWSAGGGGTTTPTTGTTDAAGLAQTTRTLPSTPGQVTTTATATIGGSQVTAVFTVTAATTAPALITKAAGDNQTGTVATTLGTALRVLVLDATGAPQANVAVAFTTANVGGSFPGGASILTDASGAASTTWRLGSQAGVQTAQASIGGPAPAVFSATALAGALDPGQSTIALAPATIAAGGPATTITVTAKDGLGNPISGLPVVLSNSGGGSLTQPTTPTNASGQASGAYQSTATGLRIVSATVGGQSLASTATITVEAGPPVAINALSATAFAVRFGQSVAPLPSVQVVDAFGNGVAGLTVSFGITSGQSAVSPTTVVTNAAGVATANSWIIASFGTDPADNVYNRLIASAAGNGIAGNPVAFLGTATVSFAGDLAPYFGDTCAGIGCHSTQVPIMSNPPSDVYTDLVSPSQRYVIPGDSITSSPSSNLLFRKPGGLQSHTGGTFAASIITAIKAWIRAGAPNN